MNIKHHNKYYEWHSTQWMVLKEKLWIYCSLTCQNSETSSVTSVRMNSQTYNPHKLVPSGCIAHSKRIEFNQIIIKYDVMVLKLELKRCADLPRTTYRLIPKSKLLWQTNCFLCELFPNPARQIKWINELLLSWYISQKMNERDRYSAIIIEITSGAYQSSFWTPCGGFFLESMTLTIL